MDFEENSGFKLLVLTSSFPGFIGDNAGSFVYELANTLSSEDIKTLVLAPLFNDQRCEKTPLSERMNNLDVRRFVYFYPVKYQRLCRDGGFVYNLKKSHLAKVQLPLFLGVQLFSATKIMFSQHVDIIHTHWMLPQGLTGAIIHKLLKKPHILTIHAADVFALAKMPFGTYFARFIVKNSSKIFVVSNYVSQCLCALLPENVLEEYNSKLTILPMGVNTAIYQRGLGISARDPIKKKKFTILFVGRLSEKKGVIYLIQALIELKSFVKHLDVLICGDGPLRQDLERFTEANQLNDMVEFKGFITDDEKIAYMELADVLVVPSIVMDSGETEGLPVVILEGLAAGKAIIASNVSGASDVIQDGYNGFLVEQKKPDQIAEKIMFIMNNPEIRENIETNALNSSLKYDWSNISHQYEVAIKEALYMAAQ